MAPGYFAAFGTMPDSKLPFDADGRVIVIATRALAGRPGLGAGASMHDFELWCVGFRWLLDYIANS